MCISNLGHIILSVYVQNVAHMRCVSALKTQSLHMCFCMELLSQELCYIHIYVFWILSLSFMSKLKMKFTQISVLL